MRKRFISFSRRFVIVICSVQFLLLFLSAGSFECSKVHATEFASDQMTMPSSPINRAIHGAHFCFNSLDFVQQSFVNFSKRTLSVSAQSQSMGDETPKQAADNSKTSGDKCNLVICECHIVSCALCPRFSNTGGSKTSLKYTSILSCCLFLIFVI